MITEVPRLRTKDNKTFPVRVYGLMFSRINGKFIFGVAMGHKSYFWEWSK